MFIFAIIIAGAETAMVGLQRAVSHIFARPAFHPCRPAALTRQHVRTRRTPGGSRQLWVCRLPSPLVLTVSIGLCETSRACPLYCDIQLN